MMTNTELQNYIHFLDTENSLNKLIKNQKKTKERIFILYTSLWCPYCKDLVEEIKERYDTGIPLYIVDSMNMPHSFLVFDVKKAPTLVTVSSTGERRITDYIPLIYSELGL